MQQEEEDWYTEQISARLWLLHCSYGLLMCCVLSIINTGLSICDHGGSLTCCVTGAQGDVRGHNSSLHASVLAGERFHDSHGGLLTPQDSGPPPAIE